MAQGTWRGGSRVSAGWRFGRNIARKACAAGGAHLRRLQALQERPHARLLRALAAALRRAARQAACGARGAPSATAPPAGERRPQPQLPRRTMAFSSSSSLRAASLRTAMGSRAQQNTSETTWVIRASACLSAAAGYQQARARERRAAARLRVAACRGACARGRRARGARAGHCEVVVSLRACALFMPTAFLSMNAGGGGLPSSSASVSQACGGARVRRDKARRPTALDTGPCTRLLVLLRRVLHDDALPLEDGAHPPRAQPLQPLLRRAAERQRDPGPGASEATP